MKTILILLAVLASTAMASPSDEVWQMPSQWKNQRYRAWITREMFDKAPAWSPETGQEDPLSVSKAVSLSGVRLKEVLGAEEFSKWRVETVGLWQISPSGKTKWFYVVRWSPSTRVVHAQASAADFEGFTLIVTLAGECPKPILETDDKGAPNKEPEATREIDAARQEYESVSRELTAAIRERETGPEMQALHKAREEAGQAFLQAALRIPELAALDEREKALDAKLVPLRERRRAEEQAAAKTGSPGQAGESIPSATLKEINDEISRLQAERRQVETQMEQRAIALPALEVPRKRFEEIEQEMKRFLADEPPAMKEIRARLAVAQSRWHKLRVEHAAGGRGGTKAPAQP